MAKTFFKFHICRNLIYRHMSRTFNHNLHILFPSTFCQNAKLDKLCNLWRVCRIMCRTRTASVTKTDCYIIFCKYVKHLVIILIKRIFIACHFHPSKNQRTASWNDICKTAARFFKYLSSSAIYACVNCHKVNTLFSVSLYNLQKFVSRNIRKLFIKITNRIIHRHCTDHSRAFVNKFLTEFVSFAVTAKVHNSLSFHINSHLNLFPFNTVISTVLWNSEIYVYLCFKTFADTFRTYSLVHFVCRNCNTASCNSFTKFLCGYIFFFSHYFHLRCYNTLFSGIHLCCIIHIYLLFLFIEHKKMLSKRELFPKSRYGITRIRSMGRSQTSSQPKSSPFMWILYTNTHSLSR